MQQELYPDSETCRISTIPNPTTDLPVSRPGTYRPEDPTGQ